MTDRPVRCPSTSRPQARRLDSLPQAASGRSFFSAPAGGRGRTARLPRRAPATSAPVDHASRTGWGRTVRPPCDSGHGPEAAARNRCRSRAAWASGQGWRRRSWGGWSSQASNAAARQRVRRPSPRPRDRPRSRRCSRPARAAMTCRPRPWDGQRVAPVVPPAGTVDRGMALSGVSVVTGPDCGGSP